LNLIDLHHRPPLWSPPILHSSNAALDRTDKFYTWENPTQAPIQKTVWNFFLHFWVWLALRLIYRIWTFQSHWRLFCHLYMLLQNWSTLVITWFNMKIKHISLKFYVGHAAPSDLTDSQKLVNGTPMFPL
jgi:hypothetical protein